MSARARFCEGCPRGCSVLFDGLAAADRRWVASWLGAIPSVSYEDGEKLIYEGMPAFGIFLVCAGRVKVIQDHAGRDQVVKLASAGELLGEAHWLGDRVYTVSAKALGRVEAKFVEEHQFDALLARCPALWACLLGKLARELKALQERLLEASFGTCREKVARLLLAWSGAFGRADGDERSITLSRADLAGFAGVSVETAIRTLSAFERAGWVRVEYHTVTLLDPGALAAVARPLSVRTVEHLF